MRKLITAGMAVAMLAIIPSAAMAYDYNGTSGFVGKGEVQSAFGLNNQKLQDNASLVKFSSTQATSQSLKQSVKESGVESGTQTGTQSGVQKGKQVGTRSVSWFLSCTVNGKNKTFHRDGTRTGTREGSREVSREVNRDVTRDLSRDGIRTGSRAGVINGSIAASIAGDPRQTKGQNQFTGFNLKGLTVTGTDPGTPVWNPVPAMNDDFTSSDDWSGSWSEPTWSPVGEGTYTFTTGYTFSDDVEWGGWDAAPGENPADCLRTDTIEGQPVVTDLVNNVTDGAITDGAITDGDVTSGDIDENEVVPTGIVYSGNVVAGGDIEYGPVVPGAYKLFATIAGYTPPTRAL